MAARVLRIAGRLRRPASSSTRHPLVAAAMVLPPAALLAVVFGGWNDLVVQAVRLAGLIGR